MSLGDLASPRTPPRSQPTGYAGAFLEDAASAADELLVRLDVDGGDDESTQPRGPMPFMPRGAVLPSEGDPCVVGFDEQRQPFVAFWRPA